MAPKKRKVEQQQTKSKRQALTRAPSTNRVDDVPENSNAAEDLPENSSATEDVPESSNAAENLLENSNATEDVPENSNATEDVSENSNAAEDVLGNSNGAEDVSGNSTAAGVSLTAEADPVQVEPNVQETLAMPEGTQMEEDVSNKGQIKNENHDSFSEDAVIPEVKQMEEDVPNKERIAEEGQDPVAEEPTAHVAAADDHAETVPGDSVDNDDEPEAIHSLLEPLSKEQLITLLTEATEKHEDVVQSVLRVVDSDPSYRKIFVHGLGWDTDSESLISEFQKYGEIEDCKPVKDKSSGKSKGYAFILFKHRSGAQKALKEPQKKIGNRMTSCQLASIGPIPQQPAFVASEYTQRKIYVSNVSADIDPQKLLLFFSTYGEIEEGPLGLDKHTGKPRGFTLFVYKKTDGAKKALEEPHKVFEGHTLNCQKAIDGPKPNKLSWNQRSQSSSHVAAMPGLSSSYASGMGSPIYPGLGNLMAPSQHAASAINPAMGQASTTLISYPAAALGLTNQLGPLASPMMPVHVGNQAASSMLNSGGYGTQLAGIGSYGGQNMAQGGYGNIHGQGSGWGYMPGYKGGAPHLGR